MTYTNIEKPIAAVLLIEEAFVTFKGDEYRFWVELDTRDDSLTYEFIDDEPPMALFDYEQFDKDCREMVKDVDKFKSERNIK